MSFQFNFTENQLAALIPRNVRVSHWYRALCEVSPKYGITLVKRVAHFISQCAYESNNFRSLEENLNYNKDTLLRVSPRYFETGKHDPAECACNPEKLTNYVYIDEFRSARKNRCRDNYNPNNDYKN